ncbi:MULTISPECIES: hypothetical protein [Burkholderia]|uniref:Lipoprotein n=1 Tax=Burkholderia paludis TaxID=1506587 RepID=A0A6P2P8K6_9BURK|nr:MULTISPECIES: hypothetical protein [Burkholderia]CAB3760351.1 hypothetical protein LMG30113_03676 [Burkholderia paludis]VWC04505.1 hypothetical protein BPA30113_04908 [Burkholderia paludis]
MKNAITMKRTRTNRIVFLLILALGACEKRPENVTPRFDYVHETAPRYEVIRKFIAEGRIPEAQSAVTELKTLLSHQQEEAASSDCSQLSLDVENVEQIEAALAYIGEVRDDWSNSYSEFVDYKKRHDVGNMRARFDAKKQGCPGQAFVFRPEYELAAPIVAEQNSVMLRRYREQTGRELDLSGKGSAADPDSPIGRARVVSGSSSTEQVDTCVETALAGRSGDEVENLSRDVRLLCDAGLRR